MHACGEANTSAHARPNDLIGPVQMRYQTGSRERGRTGNVVRTPWKLNGKHPQTKFTNDATGRTQQRTAMATTDAKQCEPRRCARQWMTTSLLYTRGRRDGGSPRRATRLYNNRDWDQHIAGDRRPNPGRHADGNHAHPRCLPACLHVGANDTLGKDSVRGCCQVLACFCVLGRFGT